MAEKKSRDRADSEARNAQADLAIGGRLRSIRKQLGMTMKDVSSALGGDTHFTTVAKLETGKMQATIEWLNRLAEVYNLTPGEIISDTFASGNARSIPMYLSDPWPPSSSDKWPPAGHVATNQGGSRTFAAAFHEGRGDVIEESPLHILVVDPDLTKLDEGDVYCYAQKGKLVASVYRKGPDRLVPVFSGLPGNLLLDYQSVEILGQVLMIMRPLA